MTDDSAKKPDSFPSTHWSVIGKAVGGSDRSSADALRALVERYYDALYAHLVLKKRLAQADADDIIQGFIADKFLERSLLTHAERGRGKFRSLLLKALNNYAVDWIRKHRSKAVSYSDEAAQDAGLRASDEHATVAPSEFDVVWARRALSTALRQMQTECEQSDRQQVWNLFRQRMLLPILRGCSAPPYEEIAPECGFTSAEQAANALVTAKRHFQRVLRSTIAEYVEADAKIDQEIADLRSVLAEALPMQVHLNPMALEDSTDDDNSLDREVDHSDSQRLSEVLGLAGGQFCENDSEDSLAHTFREQLSIRFVDLVPDIPDEIQGETPFGMPLEQVTIADVLAHPETPLKALKAIKRDLRRAARVNISDSAGDCTTAIYFLSIATAFVRHGERISKSDDEVLRYGFQYTLQLPFLNEAHRSLLNQALVQLNQG